MERYKNLKGISGIDRYEIKDTSITIEFEDGGRYLYDYQTPGKTEVEKMKELARLGLGLNTYISTKVKKRFAARLD